MILKQSGGAFPHQTPFGQLSACAFLAQSLHQPLPTPRQMPDSGGEGEQLLAGPLLGAPRAARPPPARCRALQVVSPQVHLPGPPGLFQGPLHCFPAEQGETRPGGVARSGPRAGGALPVGGRGARSRGPGSALLPPRTRL